MGFLDQLWGDVRNSLPLEHRAIAKSSLAALGDQSPDPHASGLTNWSRGCSRPNLATSSRPGSTISSRTSRSPPIRSARGWEKTS
jgi:hypothetical protein